MIDVLIVGAGPVGLTLANELARRGLNDLALSGLFPAREGQWRGFEPLYSSWEPSWAQWCSPFSACGAGCFLAGGCHLTSLPT